MLEDQGDSKPTANKDDAPTDSNSSKADTDISSTRDATDYSDVTSLLSYAFNVMGDHLDAKDSVVAYLMTLNQA